MKKYITPAMDIRVFNNTVRTAVTASDPNNAANGYVAAFGTIDPSNKAQVRMENMNEITKFTF